MTGFSTPPKHWVIIPAAGIGSRMAADRPKQYLSIYNKTILEHTLALFVSESRFSGILLGLAENDEYWEDLNYPEKKSVTVFFGGSERFNTVLNGLHAIKSLAQDHDWVWVHDAARPCLAQQDIESLFTELASPNSQGALLASPVSDTIKRGEANGFSHETVDRTGLWRALTPQVFKYADLKSAIEKSIHDSVTLTDEASAMEHYGIPPRLVESHGNNIKITRPGDLESAMSFLGGSSVALLPRIGSGYDVHAFEPGDSVILGGVKIAHTHKLKAHSDGDVVLHALMDALLGALALGDIGKHFPDTDDEWKGADSRSLLRAVMLLLFEQGYQVGNVDITVIAERPRLASHISAIQSCIAEDLDVNASQVSVKATTTEKLGFTGRQEGIACQASAMLFPMGAG